MDANIEKSKEEFSRWFGQTIDLLSTQEYTGIPLLMIAFPLFERYAALIDKDQIQAFASTFGLDYTEAQIVWYSFRHGLLHKASFFTTVRVNGTTQKICECGVKEDIDREVQVKQKFSGQWEAFISPRKFIKKAIGLILDR